MREDIKEEFARADLAYERMMEANAAEPYVHDPYQEARDEWEALVRETLRDGWSFRMTGLGAALAEEVIWRVDENGERPTDALALVVRHVSQLMDD